MSRRWPREGGDKAHFFSGCRVGDKMRRGSELRSCQICGRTDSKQYQCAEAEDVSTILEKSRSDQTQWCIPVIQVTQKVDIRSVVVPVQSGKKLVRPHLNQ
jgi:hypothetical protein